MSDAVFEKLLKFGVSSFREGEYRRARKQLSQAVLRHPTDVRARYWLGATQYRLGNLGEARKHLEGALNAGVDPLPDRPGAVHEYLARCHLFSEPDRALELAKAGMERGAADARLSLVAGDAYLRMGRDAEALDLYDRAWELEGESEGAPAFPSQPGRIAFARSTVLARLKRWPEALSAVDAALAREPGAASYHNRRGVILYDGMGQVGGAVECFRKAIELDPGTVSTGSDGIYYYNLALCFRDTQRPEKALDAIKRAIEISPRREYRELLNQLEESSSGRAVYSETPDTTSRGFTDVGGMNALKQQVRRIMDVIFRRRDEAQRYGIVRNGILLYGPPGCGKTFFAEAMAGEFGLTFIRVNLSSATTKYVGAAGQHIEALFARAREQTPCLLFFDELDAVAASRADAASQHEQQMVNALLQQIDANREVPGLVVVAATNRLREIDAAALREGRFDYKVKIYRPDFDARREILLVLLRDRPHDGSVDASELAQKSEGFSAAQIRHLVDTAAMAAMEAEAPISQGHLLQALDERMAERRYRGPRLDWEELILPETAKRKLQYIERFIENPELVSRLGVDPPTGVLLHGPPGTGKTTIARVLASQTDASFHAINAADIYSKWFGESESRVKELFETARDNVPAIIFIDEIEAVLGARGAIGSGAARAANAVVNTFLAEMDGITSSQRVFVIGATNRPDLLDQAVLRPGRLGETIEIALPDCHGRIALLELFSARMNLDASVDLEEIAWTTEGASGADLNGLCTAAGRNALLRELESEAESPTVTREDFEAAREELFPEHAWNEERRIGFVPPSA